MDRFDDMFMPHAIADTRATARCPRCKSPALQTVWSLDHTHELCASCGHCWRIERGRLVAVDPVTCGGCTARPKQDCITLLQREFPRFGPDIAIADAP